VAARLPDAFEGRGLLGWFGREVIEFLQERDRDREKPPALLLGVSQRSNSSVQSTITLPV
jgi:hypothetical protein